MHAKSDPVQQEMGLPGERRPNKPGPGDPGLPPAPQSPPARQPTPWLGGARGPLAAPPGGPLSSRPHRLLGAPGWVDSEDKQAAVHWRRGLLPARFLDSGDQPDVDRGRTVTAQEGVTVKRGEVAVAGPCRGWGCWYMLCAAASRCGPLVAISKPQRPRRSCCLDACPAQTHRCPCDVPI